MAKTVSPILGNAGNIIHIAGVAWFKDWNLARKSGNYGTDDERKELQRLLTKDGWSNGSEGQIEVEDLPEEYKERAVKERQERWDTLKALAVNNKEMLIDVNVFETIYVQDGKLRPIYFIGNTGNRRSEVYFPAMVARQKAKPPLSVTVEIPVRIRKYSSGLERLLVQFKENDMKDAGYLAPSEQDNLSAAKNMLGLGCRQTDLRNHFSSSSMGQKYWGILMLNERFPELKIFDRMMLPPDNPENIAVKPTRHKELIQYVNRSNQEDLAKMNEKEKRAGHPALLPATSEEVLEYLTKKRDGDNEKKIMAKEYIKNAAERFDATPLRAAFKAVYYNELGLVIPYQNAARGFNALDDLMETSDYPLVETVLEKLWMAENRPLLLNKILEILAPTNNGPVKVGPVVAAK